MKKNKNYKILFALIALVLLLFLLSSCSNDDDDDDITSIDLEKHETLIGTYTISFFEATSEKGTVSNACYASSAPDECENVYLMSGSASIAITAASYLYNYSLITSMQFLSPNIINNSPEFLYEWASYSSFPDSAISLIDGVKDIKGITGRNMFFTESYPDAITNLAFERRVITISITIPAAKRAHADELGNMTDCEDIPETKVTIKLFKVRDAVSTPLKDALDIVDASIRDVETGIIYTAPYQHFLFSATTPDCQ